VLDCFVISDPFAGLGRGCSEKQTLFRSRPGRERSKHSLSYLDCAGWPGMAWLPRLQGPGSALCTLRVHSISRAGEVSKRRAEGRLLCCCCSRPRNADGRTAAARARGRTVHCLAWLHVVTTCTVRETGSARNKRKEEIWNRLSDVQCSNRLTNPDESNPERSDLELEFPDVELSASHCLIAWHCIFPDEAANRPKPAQISRKESSVRSVASAFPPSQDPRCGLCTAGAAYRGLGRKRWGESAKWELGNRARMGDDPLPHL
jgi:hypothetical protein